jgi:hypothetical protein
VARSVQSKERDVVSAFDFMTAAQIADVQANTALVDVTTAISNADAACVSGVLGLDGATVMAQAALHFPAGTYKHTGLTYRGAPWIGDGTNVTILDYYGSGTSVNAVGVDSAHRKLLNISGMTLTGIHSTGSALGLDIGNNQRSPRALSQVRIQNFPAWGIRFLQNTFIMSFYDVNIVSCASVSGAGIGQDAAVTQIGPVSWYNLVLELNGKAGSATGGGLELSGAVSGWNVFGGTWEGNFGAAEARIINCESVVLDGVYLESELAAAGAVDTLIIGGTTNCSIRAPILTAAGGHAGSGIRVIGTARASLDEPFFTPGAWSNALISVEGTAVLNILSQGNIGAGTVTVASTARLVDTLMRNYTPTLTNVANLTSSTHYSCMYTRSDDGQVRVSGKFDANPIGAGSTSFGMSLPIASTLAADSDVAGVAANTGTGGAAQIFGDVANARAVVQWTAVAAGNVGWSFEFSYRIFG